jgi:hypothetical protein
LLAQLCQSALLTVLLLLKTAAAGWAHLLLMVQAAAVL